MITGSRLERARNGAGRGLGPNWLLALLVMFALAQPAAAHADGLPSWYEGPVKSRIMRCVEDVTNPALRTFVPPAERIAVFDNDGTLWAEQPMYFQLAFMLDRVRELAPQHPEWATTEPFKSALAGDLAGVAHTGQRGLVELTVATHAGTTNEQFEGTVQHWLGTARHPKFGRRYTELTYAPMLELLRYLRAHGFKTYVVSGGGVEFVRTFGERIYGIPPEQNVGSSVRTRYGLLEGTPAVQRLPEIEFINDGAGKPVGIERSIGRRPILAFGNSDGDFEMLEYTTSGRGPRLGLILHHDDAAREYAYDRESHVGRLDRGLDEAARRGWSIVSMQRDWRTVFGQQ